MESLPQGYALPVLSRGRQVALTHMPLLAPLISEEGAGNFRRGMFRKTQFGVMLPPLPLGRCPEATNHLLPMLPNLRRSKEVPCELTTLSSSSCTVLASFPLPKTNLKK